MEYRALGNSGLAVSRLCFGSLTISPLQANLSLQEGAGVIQAAFAAGINFIDTAELYEAYPYIRQALKNAPFDVVVTSKSYAYTYEAMRQSVETAIRGLGRDYIDIFMLHEQTSRLTLKGHREALRYLCDAKQQGLIRAIGVSTHTVEVVRAAALYDEVDVIHPILNMAGIGICDGNVSDMLSAIQFAHELGKGIYTMKALGGGHLNQQALAAIAWILQQPHISSIAVGMQSAAEVRLNAALFEQGSASDELIQQVQTTPRQLAIEGWCVGCGRCAAKCPMQALTIVDGKAQVDHDKCVLCGYCGAHCPEFCLKIV